VEVPTAQATIPRAAAAKEEPVSREALDGLDVLVVENEPAVLEGMRQLLERWGCSVRPATGREPLEILASGPAADAMILDYHLDDGNTGVALGERLRARWGDVAGIVITADATPHARRDAQARGYHVLGKPLRPGALRALLTRVKSDLEAAA
jgi:CheY-like chemotaxis protein